MSVQQTTQLIQLILNAVLMLNAAVIVLGILMLRHSMLHNQLRSLNQTYLTELSQVETWWDKRRLQVNRQLHQLQQRYRSMEKSVLLMQCAVALFASSTFLLTLRAILSLDWLVALSLWLFIVGIGALLAGLGLALLDVQRTGRLLEQDIHRGQRRLQTTEQRVAAPLAKPSRLPSKVEPEPLSLERLKP